MGSGFVIAPASRTHAPAIEDALTPFRAQLEDPLVTDVFVNGSHGMFVDRGAGTEPVPEWTASEREVRELAGELIAQGGRHVDDAHPCVDVRLRGGIRVHAVLAPIATAGTTLSIRIPRFAATTLATLVEQGMLDHSLEVLLRQAVARRANLLVSGAAGVGKTTLLSALLGEAAATERIVTIEDVAEIALDHPHHVALESRQANLEGAGEVGLARLVREALRMKPDRLVVGECRGAEVRELLSALNTGHDGGAGTVHANSLADVATRLEALGALAGLDETTLARQVTSAIEFVIHVERDQDGRRRVAAVGEFRIVDGRLFVVPKDVPQIAEAPPTRRSRRQARGSVRAAVAAPAPRATSASVSSPDATVVAASGFVPPTAFSIIDARPTRHRLPTSSPGAAVDDRPARGAVARSQFTPDGDWHRVAAADADPMPDDAAVADKPLPEMPHAGAPAAIPPALRRGRNGAGGDPRASRSSPIPSSPQPDHGIPRVVLPTFDQWRERLGIARQEGSSTDGSCGAAATHDGRRNAGDPRRPDGRGDDDWCPGDDSGRSEGARQDDGSGGREEFAGNDDRVWSEESMRARRASRTLAALTPAELDAQWTRLVEGWDTNTPPGDAGEGDPDAVEGTSSGGRAAPLSAQRPGCRGGGAWSFVPEPTATAGTGSAADASS